METLIDREIAHLARVMKPSLVGGPCGPTLPSQYWRWRLYGLLDAPHLTRTQLCALDTLLLQLGAFEASLANRPSVTASRAILRHRQRREMINRSRG